MAERAEHVSRSVVTGIGPLGGGTPRDVEAGVYRARDVVFEGITHVDGPFALGLKRLERPVEGVGVGFSIRQVTRVDDGVEGLGDAERGQFDRLSPFRAVCDERRLPVPTSEFEGRFRTRPEGDAGVVDRRQETAGEFPYGGVLAAVCGGEGREAVGEGRLGCLGVRVRVAVENRPQGGCLAERPNPGVLEGGGVECVAALERPTDGVIEVEQHGVVAAHR